MTDRPHSEPRKLVEYRNVHPLDVRMLLERGRDSESPVVHGAGIRKLDIITKTAIIPPSPIENPYQKEVENGPTNFYYFYPMPYGLGLVNEAFLNDYTENLQQKKRNPRSNYEERAKNYALIGAWQESFAHMTGFHVSNNDLVYATEQLLPDLFVSNKDLQRSKDHEVTEYTPADLIRMVGEDRLKALLPEVFKRKGFLLYFYPNLVTIPNLAFHLGNEDPYEVFVTTEEPLPANCISGIVPQSEYDLWDLQNLYPPTTSWK